MSAEGDTGRPHIEHDFQPGAHPWSGCQICGLARVAHEGGPIYRPHGSYRCPDCVSVGRPQCIHHRTRRPEL